MDKAYMTMAAEAKHDAEEREREKVKAARKQQSAQKPGRRGRRR